jgi:hypothetical protein
METLSIEDLQKLNQSIQKLSTLHDLETFGVTALSIVDWLVPSDFPLFHLTNARTGQIYLTYLPSYPTLAPALMEVLTKWGVKSRTEAIAQALSKLGLF